MSKVHKILVVKQQKYISYETSKVYIVNQGLIEPLYTVDSSLLTLDSSSHYCCYTIHIYITKFPQDTETNTTAASL